MTTSRNADYDPRGPGRHRASLDEQARTLGTPPVGTGELYVRDGIFESDEEVDELICFLYESRRNDVA